MNNISINIKKSERLYGLYTEAHLEKTFPEFFRFNPNDSLIQNLNRLAVYTLAHSSTTAVFYSFNDIFLDIVSRWISNTRAIEEQYTAAHSSERNVINGSIVFSGLSKLARLSSACLTLIDLFVNETQFFEQLQANLDSISQSELESVLLSFYRLLYADRQRFKSLIIPEVLYSIIQRADSTNVSKYLAIELLSFYLSLSEAAKKQTILTHIGDQNTEISSSYEGDSNIDYRFIALLEAKKLSNYSKLPEQASVEVERHEIITIGSSDLSHYVTSVCGVLVPKLENKTLPPSEILPSTLVPTLSSVNVLKDLAHNVQTNKPVMLVGKAGSGKTFLIDELSRYLSYQNSIVKIHLGEQTDAKLLLGTYVSGDRPGTFVWRSGVLTTAVQEGRWVLIEDIDKAPTEVLSVLLTLLEQRQLIIPSRGETIKAKSGFQLISTIRVTDDSDAHKIRLPDLIGLRLWNIVHVKPPSEIDLTEILTVKYPLLKNLVPRFLKCFDCVSTIYQKVEFISLNKGSHPRVISTRDLMKFCSRVDQMLKNDAIHSPDQLLESTTYDNIFAEAVDCFASAISEFDASKKLIEAVGESLEIPSSRINLYLSKHVPLFQDTETHIRIGRAKLEKASSTFYRNKSSDNTTSFARTNHSLRLMEQIGTAVEMVEPILLVGETGTGKTTVVQQIAKLLNKNLTVINLSQQTESGDLLGGYKPVNTKSLAIPLLEIFEVIFKATFSQKRNEQFSVAMSKAFNRSNWKIVIKLWQEAIKLANSLLNKAEDSSEENPKKKRKLSALDRSTLLEKWNEFETKVSNFELQFKSVENSFVFDFVEGSLVKAVKNGDWLLLDEINLASSDTLESIADLLSETVNQRSILLTEKGDVEAIHAHNEFRIFGCMNPSTDVGKKDLPVSIRSRFSEIYVHSPDRDLNDLLSIIDRYIARFAVGDEWAGNDIAQLYLEAKALSESNSIVDGANQRPHFSIRTLTRTLIYVRDIVSIYGLRRSLYEGFCMSFLTLLDAKSENVLKPLISKYTVGRLKNAKSVISQCPPAPSSNPEDYVQFKHYWLQHGPGEIIPQDHYIITPFVEKNMLNLVRAIAGKRFPVLVQGPTSSGKTSMINYLANITGHKFVRINNHEHTDLQEYLGSYVSDSNGKLTFKEGVLVEALRKGYWIVLDELNLAPTDVLEALNRLLDDNRELFIPETQEVVHPHPDFRLFATQNPPGIYGGRKVLSRAFRNRFLELHFDDIPQDELETILIQRCKIAPSYGKKIVEVYKALSVQRQSTRLFEEKNSFATLRDLFRWALREAVGYEQLAANGYMLLAERVRKEEEKSVVKKVIEKVMKVKLDMDSYYEGLENKELITNESSVVWTRAMRRLAVLVSSALQNNEPLLLVGETGCGKTTICQILANYTGKKLVTVNAHQNTETGDLLGAQRPVRNKLEIQSKLTQILVELFSSLSVELTGQETLDELIQILEQVKSMHAIQPEILASIQELRKSANVLFEWNDGPLVQALKDGNLFLLDEISLADDSVLERLNSVLEPERSLLLAEKGTEDSFITAVDGFQFLATMNPGGDYGKKELSPALRNRFTEIWVPSMNDFADVKQIVSSRLREEVKHLSSPIVRFSKWFGEKIGNGDGTSGVISLRDILAWVQFINSSNTSIDSGAILLHGAAMVFIDSLGTNNTAFLADNEIKLKEVKLECVSQLSSIYGENLVSHYTEFTGIEVNNDSLVAGIFRLSRDASLGTSTSFNLSAPTTAANAMRVIRAMQVHKPILLEGSPGVGKTSLVSALAAATGNPLTRINLSEQTDLVDLFGSDAPAEGGKTGEFVWRDAPFLRAMQRGEWVLLDEMNLASQSVLEGLNACLDHRGETYIPELDKSFICHPDFMVFAAQNPQYQGGGRKGLPKSFVNRFSVVYVDMLKSEDLNLISQHLFPNIDRDVCSKAISFISQLEDEVSVKRLWGSSGGPWEFNLRDTLRWLQLYDSRSLSGNVHPGDFFQMVVEQRFRSANDRIRAVQLFESIFGPLPERDNYFSIGIDHVQVGGSVIKRSELIQYDTNHNLVPLQANYSVMESAIRCINNNWPLILVGPAGSGKTELVRYLGNATGFKVIEFSMNSEVDNMDILGGYEQVDATRGMSALINEMQASLGPLLASNLIVDFSDPEGLRSALHLFRISDYVKRDLSAFPKFIEAMSDFSTHFQNEAFSDILARAKEVNRVANEDRSVRFEWFDGLLVQAVEKGDWLILDNANLCSPSVLDRLNSLLEPNGSLIINECSMEDGQPRILQPHPNFRLFLTMDPKFGELSRAMRNRGIELYMEELDVRSTSFDNSMLISGSAGKPVETFLTSTNSSHTSFSKILDSIDDLSEGPLASAIIGLLSFDASDAITSWSTSIQSSSDFSSREKERVSEVLLNFETLTSSGMVPKLKELQVVKPESVAESIPGFEKSQSFHPLVNSYVFTVEEEKHRDTVLDVSFFFQMSFEIFESLKLLGTIESRAMTAKLGGLSFLEQSIAVKNGRNIKVKRRSDIYSLVKGMATYISDTFNDSEVYQSVYDCSSLYKCLFELNLIWRGLVDSALGNELAKLRVFQGLIVEWIDKNQENSAAATFIESLRTAVNSIGKEMALTTGTSMARIWNHFRPVYPDSEAKWNYIQRILDIASEFDKIASQQSDESNDAVNELRVLLLNLYSTILKESGSYDELLDLISSKVSSLNALSSEFRSERKNNYQHDFLLLSNMIQSNDKSKIKEILSLASRAGHETASLISVSEANEFKPFPPILDSLWPDAKSLTKGLFSDEILFRLLKKCQNYDSLPGNNLFQDQSDLRMLAASLISNSPAVMSNQLEIFKGMLIDWFIEVVYAHIDTFADNDSVTTILAELKNGLTKKLIQLVSDMLSQCQDDSFATAMDTFFVPSLILLLSIGPDSVGKAWVLFASGCIHLYIPSSVFDPAIEEHVIYQLFFAFQNNVNKISTSWTQIRSVISGDESIFIERNIPIMSDTMEKPCVFRPSKSIDGLFEEWNSFMESSVGKNAIEDLLNCVQDLSTSVTSRIQMFQSNSDKFLVRLKSNYMKYSDVNDIVRGFVLGLKLGFDLIQLERDNLSAKYQISTSWSVDIIKNTDKHVLSTTFETIKGYCKDQNINNLSIEQIMMYFLKVSFIHTKKSGVTAEGERVLNESFQSLYYRWSLRQMKIEGEEKSKDSLYKYTDPELNVDDDFKKLFPDYEDVMDVDESKPTSKQDEHTPAVYSQIAKLYMDWFLKQRDFSLTDAMKDGNSLLSQLERDISKFRSGEISSTLLTATIIELDGVLSKMNNDEQRKDFYYGSIPSESKVAISIINKIGNSVQKLLEQWPEHATLQNINSSATEFLNYPIGTSLARLLQKIEQIYTFISEWEKYAHSGISLKVEFDSLTKLIVSWRRLELSTWGSLFEHEDSVMEEGLGKWWFYLFETIMVPLFNDSDDDGELHVKLASALNLFMSNSLSGDFSYRLNLLKAFSKHVELMKDYESLQSILNNIVQFYTQFEAPINESLQMGRKKLEKDIKEVILLASWKDVNIDALKQSARRSHSSLYKIVRKYRALLSGSVSPIIEGGISADSKVASVSLHNFSYISTENNVSEVASVCTQIGSWDSRPARLKDLSLINKNMGVYISKFKEEDLPSLYEYSKSLLAGMEELKKQTPTTLNDENKKVIASLKTQKRKLLSDTLKEARRMGLKTSITKDIHQVQETVTSILAHLQSFEGSSFEGNDSYFFRILDIIPRLRAAVASPAEDVPVVDIQKGLAVIENLVFSLIATRNPVHKFSTFVNSLERIVPEFDTASKSKGDLVKVSVVDSVKFNIKSVAEISKWFVSFLEYADNVLKSTSRISAKNIDDLIFSSARARALAFANSAPENFKLPTTEHKMIIEDFKLFVTDFRSSLVAWVNTYPELQFVSDIFDGWLLNKVKDLGVYSSTSLTYLSNLDELEGAFRGLSTDIILSIQKIVESQKDEITEESDHWLSLSQQKLSLYMKLTYHRRIEKKLNRCLDLLCQVEYSSESSILASSLVAFTLPLVNQYYQICIALFNRVSNNYVELSHATFILSSCLYQLSTHGFCSPEAPSETKESSNLQDGTGLGDGEGATNNSKDVEDDEDLSEQAQEPNKEKNEDKDDEDENDDAVDIEGDMAGDLEDAPDQGSEDENEDGEEEDLDEEIDDLDDLDPNAIDEKMWDEEVKEDKKEKDSDKMPDGDNSNQDDLQANEEETEEANEENNNKDPQQKDDKPQENESGEEDDEEDGEDGEDLGEQDDQVRDEDQNEQLDPAVPETEALDLPDDINLDSDNDQMDDDAEDGMDDKMDIEDEDDENVDNLSDQDQDMEMETEQTDETEEAGEEGEEVTEDSSKSKDEDENTSETEGNAEEEETGKSDGEEETLQDNMEDSEENNAKEEGNEGLDGIEDQVDMENIDDEAAAKQQLGSKGEGSDDTVKDENEDIGGNGGSADFQEEQNDQEEEDLGSDKARDEAKESLKELGDALKEFHRRHQEIKEASEDEKTDEKANVNPDEFQHVDGANSDDHDTQAMGAADLDQVQKVDEDMAIDDDKDDQQVTKENPELDSEEKEVKEEDMEEVDELNADANEDDANSKVKSSSIGDRRRKMDEDNAIANEDSLENDIEEDIKPELERLTLDYQADAPIDITEAREMWRASDIATQELTSTLCEQLRLILEPTLATKLKGDYKTGKRLNMKRIIPYIASEFRKDKIWLRRTKPSKRQYQIMIAVDDSKSMAESKAVDLAFHSIALVSKALTQLESGGLSIVKFGEETQVVHPFDKPFNQEVGAQVFQWFDFQQTRTNIQKLVSQSIQLFDYARASSSSDLWQLQIVLSDGVCENHAEIQRLVRKAREERIMLVFVIIDGINSNQSILDMNQVSYVESDTGMPVLKVDKYLDTFPFEFYVVVRDITELPEMLSLILRQYFSEISSV